MKHILFAGGALCALAATAWAIDGEARSDEPRSRTLHVAGADSGTVIELRGENGARTVHVERDGAGSRLTVNGQTVEVMDGLVVIDGQRIDVPANSVVVVDGDEVRVIEHGDHMARLGHDLALHMGERAEHLARMREAMADMSFDFDFDFDAEALERDITASLREALEGLDANVRIDGRDWSELSDAEKAEVRAEIEAARTDIQNAMREVRREMSGLEREVAGERRRIHVELRRAAREVADAEREMERVDIRRLQADVERDTAEAHAHIMRVRREAHGIDPERQVRIERDDSGRQRIWIDGEEQTGDDLVDWLNRLESDRLAGAPSNGGRDERRIYRVERHAGSGRVIELDNDRRVVVVDRRSDPEE